VGSTVIWVVGAAIVDDLDQPRRLLAARRTEPEWLAGGWELPGGKVEADESPTQALHRELAEEIGIEVELGAEVVPAGLDRDTGPNRAGGRPGQAGQPGWAMGDNYRLRVWTARIVRGEPAPIEDHDAVVWLEPGHWLDVAWLDSNLPIVRALLTRTLAA
jgi:8-oxo-dGTP diphosphatase